MSMAVFPARCRR